MRHSTDNQWRQVVGRNVRALRTRAKLTQERAAALCDVDVKHWQDIEYGKVNIALATLTRIADAFKVSPARLFRR